MVQENPSFPHSALKKASPPRSPFPDIQLLACDVSISLASCSLWGSPWLHNLKAPCWSGPCPAQPVRKPGTSHHAVPPSSPEEEALWRAPFPHLQLALSSLGSYRFSSVVTSFALERDSWLNSTNQHLNFHFTWIIYLNNLKFWTFEKTTNYIQNIWTIW